MQLGVAFLLIGLLLSACAEEDVPPEMDVVAPEMDAATNTPDSGMSVDVPSWPPMECAGLATPYAGEACLTKIWEVCHSHQDKEGCKRQGAVDAAGGFLVYCNWVPVVTFTDATSCVVESTNWRCEGHLALPDPCLDPCEFTPELYFAWKAIPGDREMIKMCGAPIGPWLYGGMGPMHGASCLPNRMVTPPNPPLCNCIPQACEVTKGLLADPFP